MWSVAALLWLAQQASGVAAQAPGFELAPPPPAPSNEVEEKVARPKPKLKAQPASEADPAVEREKRAAQADAREAAEDEVKSRAEIARERSAAQADARDPAGRDNTKHRAAKVAEADKGPGGSKGKRAAAEESIAEGTAATVDPALLLPVATVEPPAVKSKAKSSGRTSGKSAAKAPAKPGRQPTPAYRKLRDSWLAPVDSVATIETPGRIPLVLSAVNLGISVSMTPQREDGGFDEADLQRAATAFAPRDMKGVHPIAPRLLDLVYRTMRHFDVPMVHVISGYRKDRAGSRHTQGRAIDMALPGIELDALAEYMRNIGFCGVGIYPKSGFVHLDVRDRSYFWVDNSMPGERGRTNPILPEEALAADRAATARGEAPDTYVPNNEKEDRAAARSYARRAKLRRDRALREALRAQQRSQAAEVRGKPSAAASTDSAKPAAVQRAGML